MIEALIDKLENGKVNGGQMNLAKSIAVLTVVLLLAGAVLRMGPRTRGIEPVDNAQVIVGVVFSALVLLSSLFVILSRKYGDAEQKWAYGSTGAVLGFWLGA